MSRTSLSVPSSYLHSLVFQALSHPSAVADMVYHQQYQAGSLQTPTQSRASGPGSPPPHPFSGFPSAQLALHRVGSVVTETVKRAKL